MVDRGSGKTDAREVVLLNFDALVEGPQSPFDGLIMTGALIVRRLDFRYCVGVDVRLRVLPVSR